MTAIGHQEPDRVPLFLLLTLHGAKELQVPIKEYFSKPENVATAQLRMRKKFNNDCIYTFFYAAIEVEAFGGEVCFFEDGPPNSGQPIIKTAEQILTLQPPDVKRSKCLGRVLRATEMLKAEVGQEAPIIGVVMSPFSLPVMQMGFENYLELLYFQRDRFEQLMQLNEEFCVNWANAQIQAGATAICYFDPLASPEIIERDTYMASGYKVARRTIRRINGPTAIHLASGVTRPVVKDLIETGCGVVGFSDSDDLASIKQATRDKICLLGNLNALQLMHWSPRQIGEAVTNIVSKAGVGGGLILSDNHGEIPWQVREDTLLELAEAVQQYGTYPLRGVSNG